MGELWAVAIFHQRRRLSIVEHFAVSFQLPTFLCRLSIQHATAVDVRVVNTVPPAWTVSLIKVVSTYVALWCRTSS